MTKDFYFILEQAVKAPSGHNTQPWMFRMNDKSIEIIPDLNKRLPVVDPDNRELFISLGCAVENAVNAARALSYKTDVNINVDRKIKLKFIKNQTYLKGSKVTELITQRQVNRSVYNNRIIAQPVIDELNTLKIEPDVDIYYFKNKTDIYKQIIQYICLGNEMQMQNDDFVEELSSWMRFNKSHADKRNDGLTYAVFGAPNLPAFISRPVIKGFLNHKTQNKGDLKKLNSASHLVLLTVKDNTIFNWIALGRCLERLLLKITELGIAHSYFNQPCEVKELAQQMKATLNFQDYPAIILRIGYTDMKVKYSPRKKVEEFLFPKDEV